MDDLTDEQKWRIEHAKLHEKHRGHEEMHIEMFSILIVTLVVAQIALVQWKKRHFKSYQVILILYSVFNRKLIVCLLQIVIEFGFFAINFGV